MASTGFPARPRSFLPRDPRVAEPYRLTPRLAFRIGILGALALAAFAILILRLWALQVLSGDDYLRVARDNQLRQIRVEATRGQILDRHGRVLVDNTSTPSIVIAPSALPEKGRYQEMQRLARLLDVPPRDILQKLERQKGDPLTPIVVQTDVPEGIVDFLAERQAEFPGVEVTDTQVRRYPYGTLAAQILGNVGEISKDQLKELKGYHLGDRIGQRGAEAAYDRYLRGRSGLAQLRIDASGRPRGARLLTAQPVPGDAVRLTIDARLQKEAEEAIQYGIGLAHRNENWYANGGAVVALDPRNGEVLALASWPTFDPGVYSNPNKRKGLRPLLDREVAERQNFPNLSRATAGRYPPGSTFKPVTALAAMQEGLLSPYEAIDCPAQYVLRKPDGTPVLGGTFNNWNNISSGLLTLAPALEQSCDTYFYDIGMRFYNQPGDRHPLQEWAARWGFGHATGLDVGDEDPGLLPTPEWRRKTYSHPVDKLWKPGDSIQLAIGQKDLVVTPLQMTSFYATIANGGKIVRPHLLMHVEEPSTERSSPLVRRRYAGPPPRDGKIDPSALAAVQDGLFGATHGSNGTASAVFSSFPVPIAGKTGTAEKVIPDVGLVDQSWFCGYGPTQPVARIAACVIIENGGFGGEAAAPAALKIFQHFFDAEGGNLTPVAAD